MTPDGIASLVIAIAALLLSFYSLIKTFKNENKKTLSSFRKYFFDNVIKNENLFILADNVSKIESKSTTLDAEVFNNIHFFASSYKKDIKPLVVMDAQFYNRLHSIITTLDDASVICVQRTKDSQDCSDAIKQMSSSAGELFTELKMFYCGK